MKILLLTGGMENGGAETHVYELARGLIRRGHCVVLVSMGGRLADMLSKEGVECLVVPTAKKTPRAVFELRRVIERIISEKKIDVVHSHTRITSSVAFFVCRKTCVPLVTTAHASFAYKVVFRPFERWGNAVIAVSQDIERRLVEEGRVVPDNVSVIPNGIDTEKFKPVENGERKSVFFLSRLDGDCSLAAEALCRIAPSICRRFENVRIYIGGDGERLSHVTELSERANKEIGEQRVFAVGRVTDVPDFLSRAAVFVGVSRAVLEAMSCGVPVILAGNEGYLGILDENVMGLAETTNFCCRGEAQIDEAKLEKDVLDVLGMSDGQRELRGKYLREYVKNHHSVSETVRQTEQIYECVSCADKAQEGGVLLGGYYGFDNLGDDALLRAAITRVKATYPDTPICALTAKGKKDSLKFGVRCAKRYSPTSLRREIRKAAVVVFGGGTLLQNGTSRRSILYYLSILLYAQKNGVPCELWGNGIGNIGGRYYRRKTARALSGCRYLEFRDRASAKEAERMLREFGSNIPQISVSDDLASHLEPCSEERLSYILSRLGLDRTAPIAVVAVRGTEKQGFKNVMERHVSVIVAEKLTPVFIPMFPDEDLELCRNICKRRGGVVAYPLSVSDAIGLIGHATVVLAMRYHACVFAKRMGTPFVGYGSEPKIERFCRERGGKYFTEIV